MKTKNALFELTVENIPSRFIIPAKQQIYEKTKHLLEKKNLSYKSINVYATYRRFVVIIEGLPVRTESQIERIIGPSAKLLKDDKGNYTKAAMGFAKSCGVDVSKLKIVNVEKKGEVLCVEKKIPSQPAEKILSEIFTEVFSSLEFPKNMIWEETRFVFARPIRNILALFDKKVIPVKIAGVSSGKFTYTAYFLGFKKLKIEDVSSYFKILDRNYVIVNDEDRKKMIVNMLTAKKEIKFDMDDALINENLYLCEYPTPVLVKFSNDYLKLPQELLNLVLKKQLKFFPSYNRTGKLNPYFLGIRDGISKSHRNVEEGFLNVFKARCSDAMFFYETDLKTKPEVFEERLKNLIFQKELGTMYDKTLRVEKIAYEIYRNIFSKDNKDYARAVHYIYYDLVSNVVGEFPELEGIMNYYYSENYGIENDEFKKAISEIYLPTSSSKLPSNIYSSITALAHKIDTITGNFITGHIPTGSNDPYALRRNAVGIFRILNETDINISLDNLIEIAYNSYPQEVKNKKDYQTLRKEILEFIFQRIEGYYSEKNLSPDILYSLKQPFMKNPDIKKLTKKITVISKVKEQKEFKNLSLIYKRLRNITREFTEPEQINTELFEKDEEKKLYQEYTNIISSVEKYEKESNYESLIKEILKLEPLLEDYFNKVMVMVDDKKIKENRLSLLKNIYNLISDICDVGMINY